MSAVTAREFWLLFHIGVGVAFLHVFAGGVATLLQSSTTRIRETRLKHLVRVWSTALMAALVWLAVLTGTWIVYPGYRAEPPPGADLAAYPRAALLADSDLAFWHTFGMEWKEHVAWMAPFLATAVAFVVLRYGPLVTRDEQLRSGLTRLFLISATVSLIAASLGAIINKVAPNLFLDL